MHFAEVENTLESNSIKSYLCLFLFVHSFFIFIFILYFLFILIFFFFEHNIGMLDFIPDRLGHAIYMNEQIEKRVIDSKVSYGERKRKREKEEES